MSGDVSREASFAPPWSPHEISTLKLLKAKHLSIADIAQVLERSPQAVRVKISRLKIGRPYRQYGLKARRGN